jgi:hypothetical protein
MNPFIPEGPTGHRGVGESILPARTSLVTTEAGKAYADTQRLLEKFDDPVALVIWVIDGYHPLCMDQALTVYSTYAAFAMTFRAHHPDDEPPEFSVYALAVANGLVGWVQKPYLQPELN